MNEFNFEVCYHFVPEEGKLYVTINDWMGGEFTAFRESEVFKQEDYVSDSDMIADAYRWADTRRKYHEG